MWCSRLLRPVKLMFASLWSMAMILIGLQLLVLDGSGGPLSLSFALFSIAGGQFIFMFLVADELCPQAPIFVTVPAEFLAGTASLVGLVWWLWVWLVI